MTWSPEHRVCRGELANLFELVWAIIWEHEANDPFAPLLGLARLDVVEFRSPRQGDTWKLADVRDYVGDRAHAWVDDALFDEARKWADGRAAPTLLVTPKASVELTEDHYVRLNDFAEST